MTKGSGRRRLPSGFPSEWRTIREHSRQPHASRRPKLIETRSDGSGHKPSHKVRGQLRRYRVDPEIVTGTLTNTLDDTAVSDESITMLVESSTMIWGSSLGIAVFANHVFKKQ